MAPGSGLDAEAAAELDVLTHLGSVTHCGGVASFLYGPGPHTEQGHTTYDLDVMKGALP